MPSTLANDDGDVTDDVISVPSAALDGPVRWNSAVAGVLDVSRSG